jgi:hypothetical protein
MKPTVLTTYLMMLVNTINAHAQQTVSYRTVRIDDLEIFYREAGPTNSPEQADGVIRLTEAFMQKLRGQ